MKFREIAKRTWDFIWNENSIWSWIVNIILAFIIIKYMLFPLMTLVLGSSFPVVAVVSSSMEHSGMDFDAWWSSPAYCGTQMCTQGQFYELKNITKEQFEKFRYANGFNKGDVMVLGSAKNISLGDTIVYFSVDRRPIIHRVVSLNPLQTKGDNNQAQIVNIFLNEQNVSKSEVIGKAIFRIPLIGYVKIFFVWIMSLFGVQVS